MPTQKEKQADTIARLKRRCGKLILDSLEDPTVIEIMLNPDGNLWVEKFGHACQKIGKIELLDAKMILDVVAAYHGRTVSAQNPILECEFPIDGSRFEALYPPIVGKASFALRKKAVSVFTLEDYVSQKIMTEAQKSALQQAVLSKQNILVVGGTSSGKTTLVNAIIAAMSALCPDDRIVTMEDTAELQVQAKNKFQMFTSVDVSMTALLKATMRLRPDRIIVGEVRDGSSLDLFKGWNTGHPGGAATIHANDAYSGLTRAVSLISENQNAPRVIEPLVAETVNIAVSIGKDKAGERRIKEILQVEGWDSKSQKFLTFPVL